MPIAIARGDHLPLAGVRERPGGLLQRHPARVLDLVIVVCEIAGAVLEQEEGDPFGHAPSLALVGVVGLTQRGDQLRAHPRLLGHLPRRRLLGSLVAVRVALGKPQHAVAVGAAFHGHDHDDVVASHDDAPG